MRYRSDPESAIQARVVKLFRLAGCKVYPTSQYRVSRQAVGMADLYVLHPATGESFWWECKSTAGKLSPQQLDFQRACQCCGVGYQSGGFDEAVKWLETIRVIVPQKTRSA